MKRESPAGPSCDRLGVATRAQTPKTERGGPPGCAPNLEPPLRASLPHAAGRSQVGLAGTCRDLHRAAPRQATRPGRARGGREAAPGKPGRAAPHPPALPRPNLLERRRQWREPGAAETAPGGRGASRGAGAGGAASLPQAEPGPARLALSRPPPPSPACPPATAASGRDLRISMPGAKLMGGVCSHRSKSGACLQSPAERKDHPAAGGEVAKKGKAPGRLGQRREARTQTLAAQQPRKQGTPSRAGRGTPPKHAGLLGEAGQRKETGGDGW